MSPKRQVNHNIRKHFNTIIYNISRYAEIAPRNVKYCK